LLLASHKMKKNSAEGSTRGPVIAIPMQVATVK